MNRLTTRFTGFDIDDFSEEFSQFEIGVEMFCRDGEEGVVAHCSREAGFALWDEGVSRYFLKISWIARSMSSRSEVAGAGGLSEGVVGVGMSSLVVRFFFLFLDFLDEVVGAEVSLEAVFDGGWSREIAVWSSSSGSISFNYYQCLFRRRTYHRERVDQSERDFL